MGGAQHLGEKGKLLLSFLTESGVAPARAEHLDPARVAMPLRPRMNAHVAAGAGWTH